MVDLTAPEVKVLLWHIHIIEDAYGNEAPEGSTIEGAKAKLLDELERPECNGQRGLTLNG